MSGTNVTVSRHAADDTKIRTFEVLIDGKHVGDLRFGKEVSVEVSPGPHAITATNHLRGQTLEFEAESGASLHFSAKAVFLGGIWRVLWFLGTVPDEVSIERIP